MSQEKIFIGTVEICGIMAKLNHAYSDMGIDSDMFCLKPYIYAGCNKRIYENPKLVQYFRMSKQISIYRTQKRIALMRILQIVEMLVILKIFIYVLWHYTSFIYLFSQGLFSFNPYLNRISFLEFLLLKLCNKKTVVICCGSDTRPPYCGIYKNDITKLAEETKVIAKRVHMLEKYAILIDGPASAYFHKKPFISYNCIGNVVSKEETVGISKKENSKIVIFHAPSSPEVKGSDHIRETIEELKILGYKVEFIEMSGVAHEVIMEQIHNSDILVDEMYSDFPMAMLDTEAALNAIPVVTCGYYAECYRSDMPDPIPPTCYIEPSQLKQTLIELINNPEKRKKIGEIEKKFVEDNWLEFNVASKLLRVLNKDVPMDWYYDPNESKYLWGAGCSKEKIKEKIFYLIDNYGYESLCLGTNKKLLKDYIEIYNKMKKECFESYE